MSADLVPGRSEPAERLLIEAEPRAGRWNMAFDEALLEAAAIRGETALRIYRWSEPTLSLGYFQKSVPPDLPAALLDLPRVRRLSGGGAILHHYEWTYSAAVPKGHPLARRTEDLYDAAHAAIVAACAGLGATVALRGQSRPDSDARFLCFLRGDARDVIAAGQKVVGSAQRRRRGAVLQHGSVVLKHSELLPGVLGLSDLVTAVDDDPLWAAHEFTSEFRLRLFHGEPLRHADPADLARADRASDAAEPSGGSGTGERRGA